MVDAPENVVVEILHRLPIKSLVRFRCVSKSWRSLISNPTFLRTHLSRITHSHISSGTASHILLSRYSHTLLSLHPRENDAGLFETAEQIDFNLFDDLCHCVHVKGHCDGLLCFVVDRGDHDGVLVVYNPSIREHRMLPLPPNYSTAMEPFAIGYDPSADDYKIVTVPFRLNRSKCPAAADHIAPVEIFSLKSKSSSWRSLPCEDAPPYPVHQVFQTANANGGGLYWLFADQDDRRYVIMRFDLVEEKFTPVLPTPDETHWSLTWYGSLRDSLCVIHSQEGLHIHVWSTEDDQTWTKLFTIPTIQQPNPPVYSCRYKPLCYTDSGALLLSVRGKGFLVFEPGENRLRQVAGREVERLEETVYCKSLLSPNFGNEDDHN